MGGTKLVLDIVRNKSIETVKYPQTLLNISVTTSS